MNAKKTPWDGFLGGAFHRVRSPWYAKERERKLEIVRLGRELIKAARGGELGASLDALFEGIAKENDTYELVSPAVIEWAKSWAAGDEDSLRRAIRRFYDLDRTPEERFDSFVAVAEEAQAAGFAPSGSGEVLTLGSFLNFAVEPEAGGIFGTGAYAREVERLKGFQPDREAPLGAQYREQVAFARSVESEMRAADVELADMLDVQALISLALVRVLPGQEWEIFVKHAPFVLNNPLFDSEERGYGLKIAGLGRRLLEAARDGGSLYPPLDALFDALSDPEREYALAAPEVGTWAISWAARDEASLRHALASFSAAGKTPDERFAAFALATEEAQQAGLTEATAEALTFGALMNFAVAPETAPIVGLNAFTAQLGEIRGFDPPPAEGLLEDYRQHVEFAARIVLDARAAGIGVRDMLDVQSLVSLCQNLFDRNNQDSWWLWDPPGFPTSHYPRCLERKLRSEPSRKDIPYLAVCSCLGFDAPYLLEWIEFHRLVGVERFFLYNNGDRDAQRELLAPYVEQGIVVLHEWTVFPPQTPAYDHCVREHRNDARWIACFDTDEFLFSGTGETLPEVLADYEEWPAVGVSRIAFGASGHRQKPEGLVIENYVRPWGYRRDKHIKTIVDPLSTAYCHGGHHFEYTDGRLAVDENHYPILGATRPFNSSSRLRINHYYTKSEQEFREKLDRSRPDNAEPYPEEHWRLCMEDLPSMFDFSDDAILRYVPPLKEALACAHPGLRSQSGSLLHSPA